MQDLVLGEILPGRKPFVLPADALMQTFAFIAIRGAGKTTAATILAEQFYNHGLPWIALDPTGVWWGLRCGKDGRPAGGLNGVVIIGGKHGDLPLNKADGAKIARALIESNVCAVIDLKMESKTVWRTFLADFCNALMEMEPKTPRHIFVEEGPEFVPQRPVGNAMKMAHAALDRLIRLGRNNGYGASIISQRAATIDKDVLSQCENVISLRQVMTHDRDAMKKWVQSKAEDVKTYEAFLDGMASLKPGEGYFWSPAWLDVFHRIQIGERQTFHPGATRKIGGEVKAVTLIPANAFVSKVEKLLKMDYSEKHKRLVEKDDRTPDRKAKDEEIAARAEKEAELLVFRDEEITKLKMELAADKIKLSTLQSELRQAQGRLESVRKILQPQYDGLKSLFEELGAAKGGNGVVDRSAYDIWLPKARQRGCGRMLEVLIEHGSLTKSQLGTLAGTSPLKSTFRAYMAWLKRNGLVSVEGEMVSLKN